MKLALGTAKFGMRYGVSLNSEKVQLKEISRILEMARKTGIDTLDTASSYGLSESRLGLLGIDDFKIVTKILPKNDQMSPSQWMNKEMMNSLKKLKQDCVWGLLLHRPDYIKPSFADEINRFVLNAKKSGQIKKFGISIYSPEKLANILDIVSIDLVQAPFNIIDRRIKRDGWMKKLAEKGVEVHFRSVFLQGLLLLPKEKIPRYFKPWQKLLSRWYSWIEKTGIDPIRGCLAAVNDPRASRVVVGVDTADQLRQLKKVADRLKYVRPPKISSNNKNLIMPSNWRKK